MENTHFRTQGFGGRSRLGEKEGPGVQGEPAPESYLLYCIFRQPVPWTPEVPLQHLLGRSNRAGGEPHS